MAAKFLLVLCASASLLKINSAQCIGAINGVDELGLNGNALAYGAGLGAYGAAPLGYGGAYGAGLNVAPTSGGGFAVTSVSPISPTGITVMSENNIEGPLSITGQLPFLGAIALEGALPTAGAGAINYGCGSGSIGITSEGLGPAMGPGAYPAGPGMGAAGVGYPGMAGARSFNGIGQAPGFGCRGVY